ncbi:hypothetical protein ABZZ79_06185 [Streptomyces sp. NPDC006458]|uniref:hypothetical protein n=1 Tax=Streptomyces sp. NPDC006458 TaxID=3154302 RepID=UPI0033AC08C5
MTGPILLPEVRRAATGPTDPRALPHSRPHGRHHPPGHHDRFTGLTRTRHLAAPTAPVRGHALPLTYGSTTHGR